MMDTSYNRYPDYEAIADAQELEALREEVKRLKEERDTLRIAAEAAYRYLKVEIPYSPTKANDDRFVPVVQQLRAAIDAAEQKGSA